MVRRVLIGEIGPSGGPAMTDLLGICLSWDDDACVVQPESGAPVRIPLSTIVSGKPVPPRPSPRLRIEPYDAQVRAGHLFPDLATRPLGGWLLRHSASESARRANSVLAFGDSGVEDDLAQVLAAYERPVAAVLSDSAQEQRLLAAGWVPEDPIGTPADTSFRLTGVAMATRAARGADTVDLQLKELAEGVVSVALHRDGVEVASGIGAYAADWVGFRGVQVNEEHRGHGLGRAVMAELLEWGAEQGARTAYLQVLGDNAPALALYDALGFVEHHRYRYLTPGPHTAVTPD